MSVIVSRETVTVQTRPIPSEADVRRSLVVALGNIGQETERQAIENIQNQFERVGTGDDSLSGQFGQVLDPANLTVETGNSAIHARQRELGGTILPVNGEFLTFQTYDGEWRKVREVTQEGKPYLEPAAESVKENYAPNELRRELGTAFDGI